jgi:hypothetical protein
MMMMMMRRRRRRRRREGGGEDETTTHGQHPSHILDIHHFTSLLQNFTRFVIDKIRTKNRFYCHCGNQLCFIQEIGNKFSLFRPL